MTRASFLALSLCFIPGFVGLYAQTKATSPPAPTPVADGNRFAYLDSDDPFWPDLHTPKLTTPQWIGEKDVDAAVILAIDDMRDNALPKYEAFLRPVLDELKKDAGRAPLSIMACTVKPEDPQLQTWLREGVSIEVHTLKHPCPLLKDGLAAAKETVQGSIDLMYQIPNNQPVAFRTPCCDSISTPSPRMFSEILAKPTPNGHLLSIDSSVMCRLTPKDESLPKELVMDANGQERFAKYFPQSGAIKRRSLASFGTYIEDYPYPYVINRGLWEFPCMVPSDWEAFNAQGAFNPATVADWKAALDAVVLKKGVFTFIFHPHGWIKPEQLVDFIRYTRDKYGKRVKFVNFKEAQERLNKHFLAGKPLLNEKHETSATLIADIDGDGFMDVITGRSPHEAGKRNASTRVWQPKSNHWKNSVHEVDSGMPDQPSLAVLDHQALSLSTPSGASTPEMTVLNYIFGSPLTMAPRQDTLFSVTLGANEKFHHVTTRDFDHDGNCDLVISSPMHDQFFSWSPADTAKDAASRWKPLGFELPDGVRMYDEKGRDNGVRFIDLNGDGYEDLVFSNSEGYGVYLYNPIEKKNVDWKLGWTFMMREGKAGDANSIPPIVRADGTSNGVWFKHGAMWVQNEDTSALPDKVLRIPYSELMKQPGPPPRTPEESLKALHVKKGFKAELVAREPLVQDPVWIDWDAKGRMWVVEMADYPFHEYEGKTYSGRVKILEDTDGDGVYDKATVFLDGLMYPTGLAPWKNGVFVVSVPEISFVEEKDGKPGKRTPIISGFALGNPQHLVNGFCWGLDGWYYGGNGNSGGSVKELKSGKEFNLSGRDFRFNPMTGEFQLQAGQTQYGRWRDDFGNWFGCNNSSMGWHYFMDERYLARNPRLAVPTLRRTLNNDPDNKRIFPVSAPVRRLNWPDAVNTLTSGCNAIPYRDTLFGPEYEHSFFICEPANNLVHREVLEPDGISFRSHRADDERDHEFLASEDNWSRFSMARTGPDGCLYVVDMYRQIIEHPEWIPKQMIEHLDLRAGSDKGRIYRIRPESATLRKFPRMDQLSDAQLAESLKSPNGWTQDTAQRLLLEHGAKSLPKTIATMGMRGGAQALWTFHLLGNLDLATQDYTQLREPELRAEVVRLSEDSLDNPTVFDRIAALASDPDVRVRYQMALSLGESTNPRVPDILRSLAKRDGENPDMLMALLTSAPKHQAALAEDSKAWLAAYKAATRGTASKATVQVITNHNPDRDKVVKAYASVAGLKGDAARGHILYKNICFACHKLKGEGNEIGPDLGTMAGKPTDQIVESVMDPSRAVEARYLAQMLKLKDGRDVVAMISEETANSLTLRTALGTEVVLKSDVVTRSSSTKSVMPEGLENLLKPQDVADVIAWIREK
jgi:putative membrane-bound dehydrogenase-like protein